MEHKVQNSEFADTEKWPKLTVTEGTEHVTIYMCPFCWSTTTDPDKHLRAHIKLEEYRSCTQYK